MTDFEARFGVKKKFGFGCMRFPKKGEEIDIEALSLMVDCFLENGFNYFDTARPYHGGKSETALAAALTSRYPRERYVLTNKLSNNCFQSEEEIRPFFESQLEACGVTYFDFYLMHSQDRNIYAKFKRCRAYETALALKAEGKFKHFGISFHDKAAVLEEILSAYPEIEVVQLQFNYLDFEDGAVESRKCYEVCEKYGKPVLVMGPVKGGRLVNLPEAAQAIFDRLNSGSNASLAIRFAASFPNVMTVLSGMGSMDMMRENVQFMRNFKPLDEGERAAVLEVTKILRAQDLIPCTECKYCVPECPQAIPIPEVIASLNARKVLDTWNAKHYYGIFTEKGGKASDCIACGACEASCPQHFEIRRLMGEAAAAFEAKKGD